MNCRLPVLAMLFLLLTSPAMSAYPELKDFVTDEANIIDEQYESAILAVTKHVEQNTTAEIAVVTVNSLEGMDIETYANELFEQAGIGKRDVDNGLLILVAPNERKFRIEVGYGLEGAITDAAAMEVGNNIFVPNFRNNDFGKGIYDAVAVIAAHLENDEEVLSQYKSAYVNRRSSSGAGWFNLVFLAILILSMGVGGVGYGRRRRMGFFPLFIGGFGGGFSGGSIGGSGLGGFGGGLSGGGGFSGGW